MNCSHFAVDMMEEWRACITRRIGRSCPTCSIRDCFEVVALNDYAEDDQALLRALIEKTFIFKQLSGSPCQAPLTHEVTSLIYKWKAL